jgi:Cys-rich protein (TIGR01571 family)
MKTDWHVYQKLKSMVRYGSMSQYAETGTTSTGVVTNKLAGYENSPDIGQPFRDLCDCTTPFLMACCCPCVLGGQVAQKIGVASYVMVVYTYLAVLIFILVVSIILTLVGYPPSWVIWAILWGGMSALIIKLRSRVRNMWSIEGDSLNDCCVGCFCNPCALAQVN